MSDWKPGKYTGQAVVWFDRFCNLCSRWVHTGKNFIWSRWGGNTNETISHTLGLEELLVLMREWSSGIKAGKTEEEIFSNIKDLEIDSNMILGEPSSDLCDIVQPWHALRSIGKKKKSFEQFCRDYPEYAADAWDVRCRFLAFKGIKD